MRQLLNKLSYIFTPKEKKQIVFIIFVITIGAVLELAGVSIILPFVNVITMPAIIKENGILNYIYMLFGFTSNTQFVVFLAVVVILIYILKNSFLAYMYNVQFKFTCNMQKHLSVRMMECYLRQPYSYHLTHGSGEAITNILKDVDMFLATVFGAIQFMTEGIVCSIIVVYLFIQDAFITFGVTVVMLIFLLFYFGILKKNIQNWGKLFREYNVQINKNIIEAFGGVKELKVLEREKYFIDTFEDNYNKFAEYYRKFQFCTIVPRPLMEAVCICGLMVVVIMKILGGTNMTYFIPTLSVFAVAALRMMPSFSRISSHLSTIIFNKSGVDLIYRDLLEVSELENSLQVKQYKETLSFEKEIHLDHISFSYAETDKDVIRSINLNIEKHMSIGLMGPSGQGKTTLVDIILGLLYPTKGQVLTDGQNIDINLHDWHKKLGYIPQAIFLSDDSIRKNVAYGIPDEEIDDDLVWKALEEAQLKEYVEDLDLGLDTEVGERGVRLSGGQKQRIGIARALYGEPEILVLDEATSALDNDTEAAVMEAINRLHGSKTLIIIAHRLSTIKGCDVIYQVNDGKVSKVEKEMLYSE